MMQVKSWGMRWVLLAWFGVLGFPLGSQALVADFESLPVPEEGYWNGRDGSGGFRQDWAAFGNSFSDWGGGWYSWAGFAYSQVNDTNTAGHVNQYAAWTPGTGVHESDTYAIVFPSAESVIRFPFAVCPQGFYVNNTTYAALDILNGGDFGKVFEQGDWFLLTVTGHDADGGETGAVDFYLADYRSADPSGHYVIGDWTWLDLTSLGSDVKSLHFELTSSDVGSWGMNTPNYFAMDDLIVAPRPGWQTVDFSDLDVPEDGYWNGSDESGGFESDWVTFGNAFTDWGGGFYSWAGFSYSQVSNTTTAGFVNQYAAWTPGLAYEGDTYAVVFPSPESVITFPFPAHVNGFHVNNTTYTALDILNGSDFSKAFEEGDWFVLTVTGRDGNGQVTGNVDFYLADYRSPDPSEHYLISEWAWVDLRPLGPAVKSLHFELTSSDVGAWGMNTPNYFAMDGMRWMGSFSTALASENLFDAGIPGFTGPDGIGVSDGAQNGLNPAFAGWAEEVIDYSPAPGVSPDWTNAVNALGPVNADNFTLVSLGEVTNGAAPGSITLRMSTPIADKSGPDFVVFENAFGSANSVFAELAFVEVSSDGTNFVRFPSISLTPEAVPFWGASIDPRNVFNLAGKHVNSYGKSWGTPFDLALVACHADVQSGLVDLQSIEYVRIVDIPGDGTYNDSLGNPIYDPYPTMGSGGFDLDAVGVLNSVHHHRVQTVVTGPGTVRPDGVPSIAVEHGGTVTLTIEADVGQHIIDVRVNGESVGAADELELASVESDVWVAVDFGSSLVVYSGHGAPEPSVGSHLGYGPLTLRMPDPVLVNGTTQYVCIGWSDGSGNVPVSGSGTEVEIDLNGASAITWLWTTNYWLSVAVAGEGRVDTNSSWQAAGGDLVLTALPDPWYELAEWQGDLQGADAHNAQLPLQVTGPLAVTAAFGAETLTSQRVPGSWLSQHGFWDEESDVEDAAQQVDPATGMRAWEAFYAGVMPGDTNTLFRILDMGRSGSETYVTWYGGTNGSWKPFVVEARTNLTADSNWFVLDGGQVERSPDGTNTWWSNGDAKNLYYRITVPSGN